MDVKNAPVTIEDLIFNCKQDPNHSAIETPGKQLLTYGDLRKQVRYVVKKLNSMGFGRNDRISVIMPGSAETAVLGIGIMAGFTHAPLNPQYKDEEFLAMFSRLNIKAIITQENHETAARKVALSLNILILEIKPSPITAGLFEIVGNGADLHTDPRFAKPEDTVIVMQTSGTTSVPKIVPLTQKQFCKAAYLYFSQLNISDKDISLHIVAHFHILGITHTLLSPLLGGGTVVCAKDYISADFFPLLKNYRPTFYCAAPAHHRGILNELKKNPSDDLKHHSLKYIRSTSSPLPGQTREELETLFRVPVIESYAMTESPVISINMPHRENSAGIPMVESLVIMDEKGAFLKTSENGEVAINGDVVFSGYEDEEENKRAFVNGYFRTGDIGYLDADGYLFLTGRKKELINKGGEKFSPQEIDAVLLSYPGIREAMAFRIDDPVLGEDIAAIVVAGNEVISENDLRRYLLNHLIQFKVPKKIYFVDELPKGPTGKLLRYVGTQRYNSGLFKDAQGSIQVCTESSQQFSLIEKKISEIWKTVLDVESLAPDDDFFHCGGNSLAAIELLIKIQREFHRTFPPDAIYQYPTIRQQASMVGRNDENRPEYHPLIVPLREKGTLPPLFCLHPLGGWIKEYQYISLFLNQDRPIFGIRARGLEPAEKPVKTIEEAAREYFDAIKTVQKDGPYYLLGFSAGGIYAFELACYIQSRGESVAYLGIIDMSLPAPLKRIYNLTRGQDSGIFVRAGYSLYSMVNNQLKDNPKSLLYKLFVRSGIFMSHFVFLLKGSRSSPAGSVEEFITEADKVWISTLPQQQRELVSTQIGAMSLYNPRIFLGDIALFSTGPEWQFYHDDPARGWNTTIKGKTIVIHVPGDHQTLHIEPFGQVTAKEIEESIENAVRSR
jgi:oxalate---CoA ligase